MPLAIRLRGSTWGIIACRAGPMNDHATPCTRAAAARWTHVTESVIIEKATNSARLIEHACPTCTRRFGGTRSANAPPTSARHSTGTADSPLTRPRILAERVISYTR